MVFYVGSMPPSRFILGSEFAQPEIPDHRSWIYWNKFNVSNETMLLDPSSRYRLIMERRSIVSFLDPEEEAQVEMDLDLLPLWEEKQERIEDQSIRQNEKPNISSLDRNSAVAVATFAVEKIVHLAREVKNSVFHKHIWTIQRPLSNMPDHIARKMLPTHPKIYYPRLFLFPKYTDVDDWYDPQAQFWRTYRYRISRLPTPTAQIPLPITALLRRMPVTFDVEFLTMGVDQAVRDFEMSHLELVSRGYPEPTKLQAEQLKHVQLLLFAVHHLQVAIIREDLANQMFLYNAVTSVLKSLKLSQLNYAMRVRSYYNSD